MKPPSKCSCKWALKKALPPVLITWMNYLLRNNQFKTIKMRKLKLQMQITLDGFVAGPNGENDWVFIPGKQDPEALQKTVAFSAELAAGCDTILLGRKLGAAGFLGYWADVAENQPENPWRPFAQLMVSHRKIAFSHTETSLPDPNIEVENGDLARTVNAL